MPHLPSLGWLYHVLFLLANEVPLVPITIAGDFEKGILSSHSHESVLDTKHEILTVLKLAHVELEKEQISACMTV